MENQTAINPPWFAKSKLHAPPLPPGTLARPRLQTALRASVTDHAFTLISAPAGYGKTTLLSSIPLSLPRPLVAWLTLDQEDNDPANFLAALIASLQEMDPTCGSNAQALLRELPNPGDQVRRVMGVLLNDILEDISAPFLLVLDDLHLVSEPAVYVALDYLLDHLPTQMHVAAATRHDPPLGLARLRARRQMSEFRWSDLCFTLSEVASFLNDKQHLKLTLDTLTNIHSRTEGWVTAVILLAQSLSRHSGFSAAMVCSTEADRYIFDFLSDEVLYNQDEPTRMFLLETSILPELTPALCQAVTGRRDSRAILDHLQRHCLFIQPTDDSGATYRYHALFAEFLRQCLALEMPDRLAELHRRAARAEKIPSRAIGHLLAGEHWEPAAEIIEQVGGGLLQKGLLDTLNDWIRLLPPLVRDNHPRLFWLQGVASWQKGDLEAARPLLEQSLKGFEAVGDQVGQAEALAYLSTSAVLQGELVRCGDLIRRAVSFPASLHIRVRLLMGSARLAILQGDIPHARGDLETAEALAMDSGDLDALRIFIVQFHPSFALLSGGLERIERICRQTLGRLEEGLSPLRAAIEGQLAFVSLWRGRMQDACRIGESALAASRRFGSGYPCLDFIAIITVAMAQMATGKYQEANSLLEQFMEQFDRLGVDDSTAPGLLYLAGRSHYLLGDRDKVFRLYARMCAADHRREPSVAPAVRGMMRARTEIMDREYATAERTLQKVVQLEQKLRDSLLFGSGRLLLAQLYWTCKRREDALDQMVAVLDECEPEGYLGLILREGSDIIPILRFAIEQRVHTNFSSILLKSLESECIPGARSIPGSAESLTKREIEVLRMVIAGASNRAIAEQLIMSEHTAKTHVAHILRKLNAASRTEAAARAFEMGIVATP
ncbi:MAG: LuxR C-terminal-related transcriptional regulator [Chloroflexi bacterium]|nr:LuxR C-terminal-related transcriptional regulator [Chloroflexota bacterium]